MHLLTRSRYEVSSMPGRPGQWLAAPLELGRRCSLWGQDCSGPFVFYLWLSCACLSGSESKEKKKSEVPKLCLTLCDPMDLPPDSSVNGIFQARLLEWVAISFSKEGHKCQLAHYPLIFFRVWFFDLWLHQGQSAAFLQEWSFVLQESSFVFLCFSGDPMVWIFPVLSVLCHISPLRVFSQH